MQGLLASSTFDAFKAKLNDAFRPAALQRIAEGKLFKLHQDKKMVEDFVIHMKQLILKANYHTTTHSHLLINILRNGICNEVVEYVKQSQPDLLHSHSFTQWEPALVHADQVLSKIAECKHTRNLGVGTFLFTPHNVPSRILPTAAPSAPSSSQSSVKANVHPNQPGTFGGIGVPMDISKACTEGKCAKCGGPWPCTTHAHPCHDAHFVEFKGARIFYQNAESLKDTIQPVEKDFGTGV